VADGTAADRRSADSLDRMATVLTVTEAARREVLGMRKLEADPETLALRVEILGHTATGSNVRS
jgi:hypothetical protein